MSNPNPQSQMNEYIDEVRSEIEKQNKPALLKQKKEIIEIIRKMKYPEEIDIITDSVKYPLAESTRPSEALSQFVYNQTIMDILKEIDKL